jgi:acylphosphatase
VPSEADKLPAVGVCFTVHGRVQGVGFRWWTHREAVRLGVVGTVRNRSDGTVEAEAFGSPDELDRLEQSLRRGPPMSEVERLERTEISRSDVPTDFSIVR